MIPPFICGDSKKIQKVWHIKDCFLSSRMQDFWEDDDYEEFAQKLLRHGGGEEIELSVHVFHVLRNLLRFVQPATQCSVALSRCTDTTPIRFVFRMREGIKKPQVQPLSEWGMRSILKFHNTNPENKPDAHGARSNSSCLSWVFQCFRILVWYYNCQCWKLGEIV